MQDRGSRFLRAGGGFCRRRKGSGVRTCRRHRVVLRRSQLRLVRLLPGRVGDPFRGSRRPERYGGDRRQTHETAAQHHHNPLFERSRVPYVGYRRRPERSRGDQLRIGAGRFERRFRIGNDRNAECDIQRYFHLRKRGDNGRIRPDAPIRRRGGRSAGCRRPCRRNLPCRSYGAYQKRDLRLRGMGPTQR